MSSSSSSASASAIGLFVHFGLYSVVQFRHVTPLQRKKFRKEGGGNGAEWLQDILRYKDGDWRPPAGWKETQAYFREKVGCDATYKDLHGQLDGIDWTPEHIIRVAKKMNASYVVFTTKHHDGYCLYPSVVTPEWSSKRDYVGELAVACRQHGLQFGAYYSWPQFNEGCNVSYMKKVAVPHVREIESRYQPDIWWFDGHWEIKSKMAKKMVSETVSYLKEKNKAVQINDRLGMEYKERKADLDWMGEATFRNFEDRFMPERKPTVPWEYIDTVGFSWGRNSAQEEGDYKSGHKLKELYKRVQHMGGRFMINVGPNPDGSIDPFEEKSLEEFGKEI
jgi:alpha-L-fucosidase